MSLRLAARLIWRDNDGNMLLQVSQLTKSYPAPDGGRLNILSGVSLELAAGESIAIIGPSGSGKSTLLQIIGTLDQPTEGTVMLNGESLTQLNQVELAHVRNTRIGFVFQSHYLLPQCTVWENVLVPTLASPSPNSSASLSPSDGERAGVRGAPQESVEARAERLLKRVGLAERLQHFPGQLSGGERQRVAVVRALINRPQLLLADEPTGALDQTSAESLAQLLVDLNREENVTLIVVTHSRELAGRMGKVFELKDGRLQ
jgi:ABC-type lipoprotein export system ATPase subunit